MAFAEIEIPHQDLQTRAISRLLLQFRQSPVLIALLGALVKEIQELQNAAEQVMTGRSAAHAVGEQLNGLGRIVGQPREGFTYSPDIWFATDILAQNVDVAYSWVPGGYIIGTYAPDDETYRRMIEAKVFRNFARYGSIPEIQAMFSSAFGYPISFVQTGQLLVDVVVPDGLPSYALGAVVNFKDNTRVDRRGILPWPSTLLLNQVLPVSTPVSIGEATFTRASIAYHPETFAEIASGQPRYAAPVPAVLVEEGTTNLFTSPASFTGEEWGNSTMTRTPGQASPAGNDATLMEVVNANSCQLFQAITFAGAVSTVSLKVKPGTSSSLTMRYVSYDTNITVQFNLATLLANHSSGKITALAGGYFLCTLTVSLAGSDLAGQVYFYMATDAGTDYTAAVGNSMYVWQAQVEEKAYATTFTTGTRGPEQLTVPTTGLSTAEGTIECWVDVTGALKRQTGSTLHSRIFSVGSGSDQYNGFRIQHRQDSGSWQLETYSDTGSISTKISPSSGDGGQQLHGVRWRPGLVEYLINGTVRFQIDAPNWPTSFSANAFLGSRDGYEGFANTFVGPLRLSSRARTDAEILASLNGLAIDKDTVSLFQASGNLALVGPLQKYHHLL